MRIQYQPICDVISSLAESAQEIADDFFTHHTRVDVRDTIGAGQRGPKRLSLVAKDAAGRDQQRQLSKLLDDIDRLSGSTRYSVELRARTRAGRQTFLDRTPYLDLPLNHNDAFRRSMAEIMQTARAMPDETPGEVFLVPDIGAVLEFPELEDWSFTQFPDFNLVLPSTLIGELADLQNCALDQVTWKKCAVAVRHLRDYRHRGSSNVGTFVRSGNIAVRALEPVFDDSLGWLDPASPEDRTVARVVALAREHPRCVVALVTRDAHLQNRADESRIDTVLPPMPNM